MNDLRGLKPTDRQIPRGSEIGSADIGALKLLNFPSGHVQTRGKNRGKQKKKAVSLFAWQTTLRMEWNGREGRKNIAQNRNRVEYFRPVTRCAYMEEEVNVKAAGD